MGGLWDYMQTLFGEKVDEMKDPEIEIEQAINAAEKRDQELRTQAAKVVAHRTRVGQEIEDASEELGKSQELAKQAVLKADAAQKAGNADDALRWTKTAQALALRMQSAQNNVDLLKQQLVTADEQAEKAKSAVRQNAMELEEISAKRMEMLGALESATMQENVNQAMAAINSTVDDGGAPSLAEVEDKIQQRMAEAKAKAELDADSPERAMAELERESDLAEADLALDKLRADLGLTPAIEAGSAQPPSP